ncbi:MAG: hypothetical protein K8S62_06790 [Candidatus Sabulitectum sp.]|nr:hypothetical protein [Candidatus Sabulitectum sp.]
MKTALVYHSYDLVRACYLAGVSVSSTATLGSAETVGARNAGLVLRRFSGRKERAGG